MLETLTKQQRKAQKAQAKLEKAISKISNVGNEHLERWAICLKYGTKYNADYVNRLYNMVKRHTTGNVGFACMTEDPTGLNPEIKVIALPTGTSLQGWWYKPYVFSRDFPLTGALLFLDLDIVIVKNIDLFWNYSLGKFCIIRDFTRSTIPDWKKFNSSIFRFESRTMPYIWDNLIQDPSIIKRLHGDQDWLYDQIKDGFDFWPDEWCQSYKWEVRERSDVIGIGRDRKFASIVEPRIKDATAILVFHGDPKPEQVKDPIIVKNWC